MVALSVGSRVRVRPLRTIAVRLHNVTGTVIGKHQPQGSSGFLWEVKADGDRDPDDPHSPAGRVWRLAAGDLDELVP